MNKASISQVMSGALRSKTININALVTALLIWYANTHGIEMTTEEAVMYVGLGYAILNWILRALTNQSLPAKGLVVPNPVHAPEAAGAIVDNQEAVDRLADAVIRRLRDRMRQRVRGE